MTDPGVLLYQGFHIGLAVLVLLVPFAIAHMVIWRWYNRPKVKKTKLDFDGSWARDFLDHTPDRGPQ